MTARSALLGAAAGIGLATVPQVLWAADTDQAEPEAFARVVVDAADLRTGPGISYRSIYAAHRGETFALDGRPGTGFWLRVILPDGRVAYALGDEVQPFAVRPGDEAAPSRPGLFAPPPLEGSRAGLALVGGLLSVPIVTTGVLAHVYAARATRTPFNTTPTGLGLLGTEY